MKVDREFKSLIPSLTDTERELLEESIAQEGCRDALVVWQEEGLLLDGHNRYEICERLGIPYATYEISLTSREDALDWIDRNQLGRRNLTPDNFRLILGRLYNRQKREDGQRGPQKLDQNEPASTAERLAAEHGVSPATVKRAGEFAATVDEVKQSEPEVVARGEKEILARAKEIQQEKAEQRKDERRKQIEAVRSKIEASPQTPDGVFGVVVVDPPWPYGREYDPNTSRVANPYPEMSLSDIADIPLPMENDAVVFLWTTHAFLRAAFDILEQWGLQYRATLVWDKEKMGMGSTVRMQCEFCLLATRGKPILQGASERDIIRESRREHSRKPESFYAFVERMTVGHRLDYFSRAERAGWTAYGAEHDKF